MQAIDSNIWAFYLDSTLPEYPRAAHAVEKAMEGKERHRVARILTHNATFRRVEWVEVVDPVA